MTFGISFGVALLGSGMTALLIVLTKRFHGALTLDNQPGIQKLHSTPTPRIGGIALLVGSIVGGFSLSESAGALWWLMLLAGIPAFASGLIEDITKRVSVRIRLLATILSGLLFCAASGYGITHVDIPGLDTLLGFWPVAVLFTAFAIGGIANAINIIDGVNGLASGAAIIILSGFALIAHQAGDPDLVAICLVAAGAMAGFFLLNFPMGHLFLGDAGAYSTGFLLAVVAVILPARNPELSPLIGLLALAYPVIETMISILRRTTREGCNPGEPDRLHLHSLVYRSLSRRLAQKLGAPQLRNPLASVVLWSMPLLSMAMAVPFATSSIGVCSGLAVVTIAYLLLYRRVALLRGPGGRPSQAV